MSEIGAGAWNDQMETIPAELGEKTRPGDGRATASGPLVPQDFLCTACDPGTSILIQVSGRAEPSPDLIPALL